MTVTMPREKWTDERLDDLSKKIDKGFAETKAEMREGFTRVDADIRELRGEIKELNSRFDALNRNLIGGFFVLFAGVIGSIAF